MTVIRVGILAFSDGRERVHETLESYILSCQERWTAALAYTGEVEVFCGESVICSNESAAQIARDMARKGLEACVYLVPVFAFPNFVVIADRLLSLPALATSPINGAYPGLGGLQAAVNSLHQTGRACEKAWGDPEDPGTLEKVMAFLRAAGAAEKLKGQVYGLFGGRSIGMGCGVIHPDRWMQLFGVDVEHIDQSEILRLAPLMKDEDVEKGMAWLTGQVREVRYDGDKLTGDTLRLQVRAYLAIKRLVARHGLSFVGVKCHYDMSEYHYTLCLAAALLNDPYDWEGPKEPVVFACEADSDAALTMQVLHLISRKPVLFMDFRHFFKEEGLFAFCNCGACPTWYARRSPSSKENLRDVTLHPLIPKYNGTGCHVQFMAREGEMTFARFTKVMDDYKLQAFTGTFRRLPEERMAETCAAWPHGYAQVDTDPVRLVERYESNHIHAAPGNYMAELAHFCKLKNIPFEAL